MSDEQTVKALKALANPTRLKMIRQLRHCRNSEESCGELSTKTYLSQPTMSHHFGRLVEAGIIKESKVGTQKIYSLNRQLFNKLGLDYRRI